MSLYTITFTILPHISGTLRVYLFALHSEWKNNNDKRKTPYFCTQQETRQDSKVDEYRLWLPHSYYIYVYIVHRKIAWRICHFFFYLFILFSYLNLSGWSCVFITIFFIQLFNHKSSFLLLLRFSCKLYDVLLLYMFVQDEISNFKITFA